MKSNRNAIRKLRNEIHESVKCPKGCSICCSHVPMTKWEISAIERATGHPITFFAQSGTACPFIIPDVGCAIYRHRPILCRMFNNVPALKCMRAKNDKLLSPQAEARILADYIGMLSDDYDVDFATASGAYRNIFHPTMAHTNPVPLAIADTETDTTKEDQ